MPPLSRSKLIDRYLAAVTELSISTNALRNKDMRLTLMARDTDFLRLIKPVIDKKDDTARGVLTHIVLGGSTSTIKDALHFMDTFPGVNYLSVAGLLKAVESVEFLRVLQSHQNLQWVPSTYEMRTAYPEFKNIFIAVMKVTQALKETLPTPNWSGLPDPQALTKVDSYDGHVAFRLTQREMMTLAIEQADTIDTVTSIIREHGVTTAHGIKSILNGGAPALTVGAL